MTPQTIIIYKRNERKEVYSIHCEETCKDSHKLNMEKGMIRVHRRSWNETLSRKNTAPTANAMYVLVDESYYSFKLQEHLLLHYCSPKTRKTDENNTQKHTKHVKQHTYLMQLG